jgi:hypothetical protein
LALDAAAAVAACDPAEDAEAVAVAAVWPLESVAAPVVFALALSAGF